MVMLAVPMCLLYEVGLLAVRFLLKPPTDLQKTP
jgi:sec-independent protein translocase protein TatC